VRETQRVLRRVDVRGRRPLSHTYFCGITRFHFEFWGTLTLLAVILRDETSTHVLDGFVVEIEQNSRRVNNTVNGSARRGRRWRRIARHLNSDLHFDLHTSLHDSTS